MRLSNCYTVSHMDLGPVTVADAVAGELRRRLMAGQYQGGTTLRDTDLSAEFGVARPTVRAAVATLVADGLLERGRGRSAQVRWFTAADAVDLYRLRRLIEGAAVELVLTRAPETAGIAQAARRFTALAPDVSWQVVAEHDIAFHRELLRAAGSPRLLRTFEAATSELRLLVAQLRPTYPNAAELAREHEELLVALQSGDLARAQAAWADHFEESERFFANQIEEQAHETG